ncbi:hypothetical protein [Nocardioides ungokensis]|uniref:hypothetical protein n=1 Tax=Nocardioides ungokensis TaxID=1643322 RepID=UPI0015DEDB7A|nr:hypothetical protein [Nocardioides ungokensis]
MLWIVLVVVAALLTYWWWTDHRKHRGGVDIDGVLRTRETDEGRTGFYGQS